MKTHGEALIQGKPGILLGYLYKPFELSVITGNLFVYVNISISILHYDYVDMYEKFNEFDAAQYDDWYD